ncbi:MAG: ABC transporter substrate-binding protein [Planctomycetota bacterium]
MNRRRLRTLASCALWAVAGGCGQPGHADVHPATPPQHIVAGSLLAAEVLLAIAPRERIAGVHELAANPRFSLVVDEVAGLPLVGAEPEQLLAVQPDLVIVDAFTRPETLALLDGAGVPVLRTATPANFDDIAANIERIGRACHLDGSAAALVSTMRGRLAELAAGNDASLRGFRVMSLDGALHTMGKGSLFDAVVTAAGATNQAAANGIGPFCRLDIEWVLAFSPDVLVIDSMPGSEDVDRAWIAQTSGLEYVPAVRDGRVLFVPSPQFATTSHRLVDAAFLLRERLRRWR